MIEKDNYELYFLNDLYSDEVVSNSINTFRNRLYYDILLAKKALQNNRIQNGDIIDIVIDEKLNYKYGMPRGSYSLHLNFNLVPFYSEKEFLANYYYDKPLSSLLIRKDDKIFNKNIYFFIGNYLIYEVQIVMKKDECIIFIPLKSESTASAICKNHFETLYGDASEDDTWTILLSTKSDYYYGYDTRSNFFDGNKIYLSSFSEKKTFDKKNKNNSWALYVTANSLSTDIMTSTSVSVEQDEKGKYFSVSDEFKEFIYKNANNMKCFAINEPDCIGNGIYINTDNESVPIFQIPFIKNPIPKENLIVWAYDSVHKRKLHPMESDVVMTYPNIYDFSEMIKDNYLQRLYEKSKRLVLTNKDQIVVLKRTALTEKRYDLYIEWIEPMFDISAYDSYIQDYIDCYEDDYASMIIGKTAPQCILDYKPIEHLNYTLSDYMNSSLRTDYRAWRLDKLIQILDDNPKRYDELYNDIYYKCKKFYTQCYTIETDPEIFDRSVVDTREHCHGDIDFLKEFTEDTSYIKIYSYSGNEILVNLFINGEYKKISHLMIYGSFAYIYFPKSYITDENTIQIDVEFENCNPITRDFTCKTINDAIPLKDLKFKTNVCLNDLLFFKPTGEYVSIENFKVDYCFNKLKIIYSGTDDDDFVATDVGEEWLYDVKDLLVTPTDADVIVLQKEPVSCSVKNKHSHKRINLDNVIITPSRQDIVGRNMYVTTTNIIKKYTFNATQFYIDNYGFTFKPEVFKGKPNKKNFVFYHDGVILHPDQYEITFYGYGKEVEITFIGFNTPGIFYGFYNAYAMDIVLDDVIENITTEDYINLDPYLPSPYSRYLYKIYIDGKRVPFTSITTIGQGNLIRISDKVIPYTKDSKITVYRQETDEPYFKYNPDNLFLNQLMIEDNKFKSYLDEKYK